MIAVCARLGPNTIGGYSMSSIKTNGHGRLDREQIVAAFRIGVAEAIRRTYGDGQSITFGDATGVFRLRDDGGREYLRRYADEDRASFE
jgi:hypothetical protein